MRDDNRNIPRQQCLHGHIFQLDILYGLFNAFATNAFVRAKKGNPGPSCNTEWTNNLSKHLEQSVEELSDRQTLRTYCTSST